MDEIYNDLERAVDYAFTESKFILNLYTYLQQKEYRRVDVQTFLESTAISNLKSTIKDLSQYLEGGQDPLHTYLREAYGHLSKPSARRIKTYLESFIADAEQYVYDKRPGRRAKAKAK